MRLNLLAYEFDVVESIWTMFKWLRELKGSRLRTESQLLEVLTSAMPLFVSCLTSFLLCKSNLGEERVYLILHFQVTIHHPGSQDRSWIRSHGGMWLTGCFPGWLSLLSYITRTTCPGVTPLTVCAHIGSE